MNQNINTQTSVVTAVVIRAQSEARFDDTPIVTNARWIAIIETEADQEHLVLGIADLSAGIERLTQEARNLFQIGVARVVELAAQQTDVEADQYAEGIDVAEFDGATWVYLADYLQGPTTEQEEPTVLTLQVVKNDAGKWVVTDGECQSPPYRTRDLARIAKAEFETSPRRWQTFLTTIRPAEPAPESTESASALDALLQNAPADEEAPESQARPRDGRTAPVPELQDGEAIELNRLTSRSDKMRYLTDLGWTPAAIATYLGANYAFVYGVVRAHRQGKKWLNPKVARGEATERRRKIKSTRYRDELEAYIRDGREDEREAIMNVVRWLEGTVEA